MTKSSWWGMVYEILIGVFFIALGVFLAYSPLWGAEWLSDEAMDTIVVGSLLPAPPHSEAQPMPLSEGALGEI